jgi:hypothetical protein
MKKFRIAINILSGWFFSRVLAPRAVGKVLFVPHLQKNSSGTKYEGYGE